MAVAAARNEKDIYNWEVVHAGSSCTNVPVLTDAQMREVISSQPDFTTRLADIKQHMRLS